MPTSTPGRRYRFANRAYAEWFGLSKDSIISRSVVNVFGDEAYAAISPAPGRGGKRRACQLQVRRLPDAQGQTVYARSAVVPDVSLEGGFAAFL